MLPLIVSLRCSMVALAALVPVVAVVPDASARLDGPVAAPTTAATSATSAMARPGQAPRPAEHPAATRGVWPLSPRPEVVERFDPPLVSWGAGHRGVDLAGTPGQQVRATLPGRVSFAGRVAGRPVVVVDHGRTRTTYQPVVATRRRGAQVEAGDVVGRLMPTGSHCPPRACLHWGLRRGETYLDPLTLLDLPQPVRLFPW